MGERTGVGEVVVIGVAAGRCGHFSPCTVLWRSTEYIKSMHGYFAAASKSPKYLSV